MASWYISWGTYPFKLTLPEKHEGCFVIRSFEGWVTLTPEE